MLPSIRNGRTPEHMPTSFIRALMRSTWDPTLQLFVPVDRPSDTLGSDYGVSVCLFSIPLFRQFHSPGVITGPALYDFVQAE